MPEERGLIGWWKKAVFENYANFSGRARRSEYWFFTLFNFLVNVAVNLLVRLFGGSTALLGTSETLPFVAMAIFGLFFLFALVMLIPSLAVSVRRLHDTGRSGWNLLWSLLPIIGTIVLIVFFATEGQPGRNKYGPNPKFPARDDVVDHFGAAV